MSARASRRRQGARGRILRLLAVALVAAALAPGTWWRERVSWGTAEGSPLLTAVPLSVPTDQAGPLRVTGLWWLRSTNQHFGGFSALLARPGGRLFAASDRGRQMDFSSPSDGGGRGPAQFAFFAGRQELDKAGADIESLTADPASGRIWAGYEGANAIERYDPGFANRRRAQPAAMRDWPRNSGPEAILHLRDGRFIVLAEGDPAPLPGETTPGLLFPADPVDAEGDESEPLRFRFPRPDGFRPVDMAQLPDGRVLILLRKFVLGLPPHFETRIILADPARITGGGAWSGETLFELASPLPRENYEGMAIVPGPGDAVTIWLISDDNTSVFQRTLLMRLAWSPSRGAQEKARDSSRAPG
ncbi:conserved hypothetical protein [Altererythrobacter sp. B11]|uniref:esterase-like activity of phytase family protein n=1 Tax=Altererythrobacter sp. B11 TaxID=2060312 RepID=UPI000DC70089|nr:esterase-like activity of phytase family protein [Altererythrobacter sp. B11]BBC71510.1 conserved hypothetical protein [Altererythrobacter sp. B11]